ncbi:MgtC/SapB family protein [Fredinandcohnia onubensis]|uniref:MgtC/SapB family protein n=1 Tax=Fredinandcohnia onubensis TaxID=1571209 RepID=UPI000C0BB946|nr:MgtC/SapB family protein [Fredinandcohnia onubensis]
MIDFIASFQTEEFLTMSIRIFLAALLCGLVGLEREVHKHPAGFRTHLLVGVGSCLMMLMSIYGFQPYLEMSTNVRFDPARIPSYVISGIGFLGAGTILVRDATVRGLTTAASIWVVAGLGLIIGLGMYAPAILTTIVVLLSLIFLNRFEEFFFKSRKRKVVHIIINEDISSFSSILQLFKDNDFRVRDFNIKYSKDKINNNCQYTIDVEVGSKNERLRLYEEMSKQEMVQKIF